MKIEEGLKDLKAKMRGQLVLILREQKIFFVVIAGIVVILGIFIKGLISPNMRRIVKLRQELMTTNQNLHTLQGVLKEHPNIEEEMKILKMRYEQLAHTFPPEKQFLPLAQEILRQLQAQGIMVVNFRYLYTLKDKNPLPPGFKKCGLELEAVSDYLKFGKFLEDLERQGFKFVIDKIKIVKIDENSLNFKIKMDFILRKTEK